MGSASTCPLAAVGDPSWSVTCTFVIELLRDVAFAARSGVGGLNEAEEPNRPSDLISIARPTYESDALMGEDVGDDDVDPVPSEEGLVGDMVRWREGGDILMMPNLDAPPPNMIASSGSNSPSAPSIPSRLKPVTSLPATRLMRFCEFLIMKMVIR